MPELPDIVVYLEAIERRVSGRRLEAIRLGSPFVLRSVRPTVSEVCGREVTGLRRLGKRVVLELGQGVGEDEVLFVVIHLMVAGRFQWKGETGARLVKRRGLAAFDFDNGTLILTEAGSKRRASIHLVAGEEALAEHQRGGLEVLEADLEQFAERLRIENHTLKRSLTDPRLMSGIGNAFSDEILLRAKLSPMQWSTRLDDEEVRRLFDATRAVLTEWTDLLREQAGDDLPKKVTAFRPEMGAHGKFKEPCPQCGSPIQRIVYAENECNYCAKCQTGGRLLADRALSRLLKKDWPRTLQELEDKQH